MGMMGGRQAGWLGRLAPGVRRETVAGQGTLEAGNDIVDGGRGTRTGASGGNRKLPFGGQREGAGGTSGAERHSRLGSPPPGTAAEPVVRQHRQLLMCGLAGVVGAGRGSQGVSGRGHTSPRRPAAWRGGRHTPVARRRSGAVAAGQSCRRTPWLVRGTHHSEWEGGKSGIVETCQKTIIEKCKSQHMGNA